MAQDQVCCGSYCFLAQDGSSSSRHTRIFTFRRKRFATSMALRKVRHQAPARAPARITKPARAGDHRADTLGGFFVVEWQCPVAAESTAEKRRGGDRTRPTCIRGMATV